MSDKKQNNNWEWALTENCAVPYLELRTPDSLISYLPSAIKKIIQKYSLFASNECWLRESTGNVPPEWSLLCKMRTAVNHHYSPRWTAPIFYFRDNFSKLFQDRVGLDVGARIGNIETVSKRGLSCIELKNIFLIESLIPHFKHYSNLGSYMRAIDLNAPDPVYHEIEIGDARCLFFASESFDFVTIPMMLGHGNPCATYIEIALSLCELKRVLKPGGFIYIADAGFQPTVGFAAQSLNLEVFISKGSTNGFPVGIMLKKPMVKTQLSVFDEIFKSTDILQVVFNNVCNDIIFNCNLLFDQENVIITKN